MHQGNANGSNRDLSWWMRLRVVCVGEYMWTTVFLTYTAFTLNFIFYGALYGFSRVLGDMGGILKFFLWCVIRLLSRFGGYGWYAKNLDAYGALYGFSRVLGDMGGMLKILMLRKMIIMIRNHNGKRYMYFKI
jgi:hypothetical protein